MLDTLLAVEASGLLAGGLTRGLRQSIRDRLGPPHSTSQVSNLRDQLTYLYGLHRVGLLAGRPAVLEEAIQFDNGGRVSLPLMWATGLRTDDGEVDQPGLRRLMDRLPVAPHPDVGPDLWQGFVADAVARGVDEITVEPKGRGWGQGMTSTRLYMVRNRLNGELIGMAKEFPKLDRFGAELSAWECLTRVCGKAPRVMMAARSHGPDNQAMGMIILSAGGPTLYDRVASAGHKAGSNRVDALARLNTACASAGEATKALHTPGSGSEVSPAYIQHYMSRSDYLVGTLTALETTLSNDQLGEDKLDLRAVRRRQDELKHAFQAEPGVGGFAHGDLTVGNVTFDPESGTKFIDPWTLHRSMDANGKPVGAPAIDFAIFLQSLAAFGLVKGLFKEDVGHAQRAFSEAYGTPPPEEAVAFFRALAALEEVGSFVLMTAPAQPERHTLVQLVRLAKEALRLG